MGYKSAAAPSSLGQGCVHASYIEHQVLEFWTVTMRIGLVRERISRSQS